MERFPKYQLTKEEAHNWCVEAWNDMAENGYYSITQSTIMQLSKLADFACDYYCHGYDCRDCPFITLNGPTGCMSLDTETNPYTRWIATRSTDKEKLKEAAIEIADLFID